MASKTRTVREFLMDFKQRKLDAEIKPSTELITFLDWLISNVEEGVLISQRQERNVSEIDWVWWSSDAGKPVWYVAKNLFEIMPSDEKIIQ